MQIHSTPQSPLKPFILYQVASTVLLSGCSLLPLLTFDNRHLFYYLAMIVAIVTGTVHIKYLNRIFNIGAGGTFGVCIFFTLLPVLASLLISGILYYFLPIPFEFLTFQTGFVVPFLIYQAHESFLEIPEGTYKSWSYPRYDQSPKTDGVDHSVTELVNLVLSKEPDSTTQTSFRLDAPVNMQFGDLFFNFLNEYNKAHPEKEIIYADRNSRRFGWTFYMKRGWLLKKAFIDPEASFRENGIRRDEVIYAVRNSEEEETSDNYLQEEDLSKTSLPLPMTGK